MDASTYVERIARPTYGARRRDALDVERVERKAAARMRDAERAEARAFRARLASMTVKCDGCGGARTDACTLFCMVGA